MFPRCLTGGVALSLLLALSACKEDPDDGEWPDPVGFALAIDCGGGGESDGDEGDDRGERDDGPAWPFVADVAYAEGLGYGYEGGESASDWFPWVVGATPYPDAYRIRRDGHTTYRVDVPQEGPYVVTLGFAERQAHGPEFRVHDVSAEGAAIVHDLDVFGSGGQDLAWTVRREVVVTDGVLDLSFTTAGGYSTSLATLAVERANPHDGMPPVPEYIEGIDSYGAVVVRWSPVPGDPGFGWDPAAGEGAPAVDGTSPFGDVMGYQLERKAVGGENFSTLFGGTWPVPFYVDRTVDYGQRYEYRVRAVDVWGNLSDASSVATGEARSAGDSPLPVYEIDIAEEDLRTLQADPWADTEVDLLFRVDGEEYTGDGRFRGASTRGLAKKSWRVELDDPLPDGRHKLDLKAEWSDWTQVQEVLSYDLFWAEGGGDAAQVHGSRAAPVQLVVNGMYDGLRLDVERIDGDFLVNSGRDPAGDVYRGGGFGSLLDSEASYEEAYRRRTGTGDIEHLIALLEFCNRAHRDEFATDLAQVVDLPAYVDLLAVQALLARPETEADDYFYYRDPDSGLWEVLTWDNNNGNFGLGPFWPGVEPWAPPVHMSLWYAESAEMSWWHLLRTRLLNHPGFREQLATRIDDLLGSQYQTNAFKQQIHLRFDELDDEIQGDPFKYPWAEHALFDQAEDALVEAVDLRADLLVDALDGLASPTDAPLVINEFGAYACAEDDPPCEPSGFIELFNRGEGAVEFAGYHLTGDLRDPLALSLPEGELAPGEIFVLDAGTTGDTYPLPVTGGELGLFRIAGEDDDEGDGFEVADLWWYGRLTGGLSYGRTADGAGSFGFLLEPSEGEANGGPVSVAPHVGMVRVAGDAPAPGDPLPILVDVDHPSGIAGVTSRWRAGVGSGTVSLADDGQHGDGAAGDGEYGAVIDGIPGDAAAVELWVEAVSSDGIRQVSPRTAPARVQILELSGD